MGTPTMTAIRTAIRNRLIQDGPLVSLLGGPYVYHRNVRKAVQIPSITYLDYTSRSESVIPRLDTRWQFDVWGRILGDTEIIGQRVVELLDLFEAADVSIPGLTVSTGEATIAQFRLLEDFDNLAPESDDISRKTLMFMMVSFALTA